MELSLSTALILSGLGAWLLYSIISVKGALNSQVDYGRQWFSWMGMLLTISILPKFYRGSDIEFLLVWLMSLFLFGGITFILGWFYGIFAIRKRLMLGKSDITSVDEENVSAKTWNVKSFDQVIQQAKKILSPDNVLFEVLKVTFIAVVITFIIFLLD